LQKGVKQTGVVGTAATGIGTAACLAESWEKVVIQMQLRLVGCLVTFASTASKIHELTTIS